MTYRKGDIVQLVGGKVARLVSEKNDKNYYLASLDIDGTQSDQVLGPIIYISDADIEQRCEQDE